MDLVEPLEPDLSQSDAIVGDSGVSGRSNEDPGLAPFGAGMAHLWYHENNSAAYRKLYESIRVIERTEGKSAIDTTVLADPDLPVSNRVYGFILRQRKWGSTP